MKINYVRKCIAIFTISFIPFYSAGQGSGNCLRFDGSNDYVDCGPISLGTSDFSFEMWTYRFSISGSTILGVIGNWVPGSATPYFYCVYNYPGNNQITMAFHNGSGFNKYVSCTIPVINTWLHVAGVFNRNGNMEIYINGEMIASTSIAADAGIAINSPLNRFNIGGLGSGLGSLGKWWGYIDEVRLWKKALTGTEIKTNMCKKLIGNEPLLLGYWRFDDVAGATAADSGPFGYHGTLN